MKPCPHEAEVQAILRQGHWPEACDPEFRSHVQTCPTCNDPLLVLHAFHAARAQAMQAAGVDHPDLLWWRAQLCRRNDALERVGRPITRAQIFALCISVLAAAALPRSQIGEGFSWSSWLPESSSSHFDALPWYFRSANTAKQTLQQSHIALSVKRECANRDCGLLRSRR